MCSSHSKPLSFACFVAACLANSALRCDAAFSVTGGRIVAVRAAAVPSTVMMRRGMPFFFERVALEALLLGCRVGGVGSWQRDEAPEGAVLSSACSELGYPMERLPGKN